MAFYSVQSVQIVQIRGLSIFLKLLRSLMRGKGFSSCQARVLSLSLQYRLVAAWQFFLQSHSKCRPVISSLHMIQFTEYGSCLKVKLDYLYTDELPHLPMVTFIQSSHCLKTKWNWHKAKGQKNYGYAPRVHYLFLDTSAWAAQALALVDFEKRDSCP